MAILTDEDFDPRTKRMKPRALDMLSIDDLPPYIADMQTETTRVEGEIAKKEKSKNAADAFFKPKSDAS